MRTILVGYCWLLVVWDLLRGFFPHFSTFRDMNIVKINLSRHIQQHPILNLRLRHHLSWSNHCQFIPNIIHNTWNTLLWCSHSKTHLTHIITLPWSLEITTVTRTQFLLLSLLLLPWLWLLYGVLLVGISWWVVALLTFLGILEWVWWEGTLWGTMHGVEIRRFMWDTRESAVFGLDL